MKILELTLVNFARVFSGMSKTKITIDLRNSDRKMNLFVGDNGTGKTSILRCLHPFAFNSSIGDTSLNGNLIMKDKDGRKTIIISSNDETNDIYMINHIYTRGKDNTISVKSYISENGIELNESGVSSTFKAIVLEKFGIDETFLTLLSMSNSVKGFVEYTAGLRKNYACKIFDQLEIYNKKYKELQAQDRSMKALLTNVTSKLSKYSHIDRNQYREDLKVVENGIGELKTKYEVILSSIGNIQGQLDSLGYIKKDFDSLQDEMTLGLKDLVKLSSKRLTNYSLSELVIRKERLINERFSLESELNSLGDRIKAIVDLKSGVIERKQKSEFDLGKFQLGESVSDAISLKGHLERELKELTELGCGPNLNLTLGKDESIRISIYLDEVDSILHNLIYDIDNPDNIQEVYHLYKTKKTSLDELKYQYNKAVQDREMYQSLHSGNINIKIPQIRNKECDKKCQYREFYDSYVIASQALLNPESELKLKAHEGKLMDMMNTMNIFHLAESYIGKNISIESREALKELGIFDSKNYIELYLETKSCFDKNKLDNYIQLVTSQVRYNEVVKELHSANDTVKYLESNQNIYENLQSQIQTCDAEIEKFDSQLEELKEKYNPDKLTELTGEITKLEYEEDIENQKNQVTTRIDEIQVKMKEMDSSIRTIMNLKSSLDDKRKESIDIQNKIKELSSIRDNMIMVIRNIDELEKEEIEIRDNYDKISYIRYALSPTTGLPIEFIESYIKDNMADKINDLLDSVYHGRLRLFKKGIEVSEDSFVLPYIKNGTTVIEDISMASDGEKAILSLAFSLVLIQLTQNTDNEKERYCILLLDERDATLDASSRAKFLDMIDVFTDPIKAEQVFMISHNNMFDSYPVTVIMTSETQSFNYRNADVIKLY